MKTKKVRLAQLKITSFVTSMDNGLQNTVKAGFRPVNDIISDDTFNRCPSEGCQTQNAQQCPSIIDGCPTGTCRL